MQTFIKNNPVPLRNAIFAMIMMKYLLRIIIWLVCLSKHHTHVNVTRAQKQSSDTNKYFTPSVCRCRQLGCGLPEPGTWGTSSHLWGHHEGAGSDKRCGSCRHTHHKARVCLHHLHPHTPSKYIVPPAERINKINYK